MHRLPNNSKGRVAGQAFFLTFRQLGEYLLGTDSHPLRKGCLSHWGNRLRKVKINALLARVVLNAKHTTRHASMSVGVLLHFNAASQHIFDFSVLICFPNGELPDSGVK